MDQSHDQWASRELLAAENALRSAMNVSFGVKNVPLTQAAVLQTLNTQDQHPTLPIRGNESFDGLWLREHVSAWIKTGPTELLLTGKPQCSPTPPTILRVAITNEPDFHSFKDVNLCLYRPTHEHIPRTYGELFVRKRNITDGWFEDDNQRLRKPPGSVAAGTIFTDSEETFELAQGWITNCTSRHKRCSQPRSSSRPPTRIIDLELLQERGTIRVRKTDTRDRGMKYVTLSHCWGNAEIRTLNQSTSDALFAGFSMDELPPTFADAVRICRRLKQRYLWIDSLCIIQDDPTDWSREARQMNTVYQNSLVTIAALTAKDSLGGCFAMRLPSAYHSCVLAGSLGLEIPGHWWGELNDAQLHTRGWVLQERLLSPRTLQFANDGVHWECHECQANDQYPEGVPDVLHGAGRVKLKETFSDLSLPDPSRGISVNDIYLFQMSWHQLLFAYSRLNLTRSQDKLMAISGIVSKIQAGTGLCYYYGLWHDVHHSDFLLSELLWFIPDPYLCNNPDSNRVYIDTGEILKHEFQRRAPSYSWAAVDGALEFRVTLFDSCITENTNYVNVGASGYTYSTSSSQYSQFTNRYSTTLVGGGGEKNRHCPPSKKDTEYRSRIKSIGSGENVNEWPYVVIQGPLRTVKLRVLKHQGEKDDFLCGHMWESPWSSSISTTTSREETEDEKDPEYDAGGTSRHRWFFPDTMVDEGIQDESVYCLTIVRWRRYWNNRWYVAGLVLREDRSLTCGVLGKEGLVRYPLYRIGYFEHSWNSEHENWRNDGEVKVVTIA